MQLGLAINSTNGYCYNILTALFSFWIVVLHQQAIPPSPALNHLHQLAVLHHQKS
jgi:hypothetical protein